MKLHLGTSEDEYQAQWIPLDIEGYEENPEYEEEDQVRFLIFPETRSMLARIAKKVESKAYVRKKTSEDEPPSVGTKDERFIRELACALLQDWHNVCNRKTGEPLECTDTNKLWLFQSLEMANWVVVKARKIAYTSMDEDEKN